MIQGSRPVRTGQTGRHPSAPRVLLAVAATLLAAAPASAVELFDGRVQIHGFYEMQTRVLAQSYDTVDGYNLAQWAHTLNLEFEWDIAPTGWGPFNLISSFVRVEARYDCVWTAGCQMVPGYRNRYGNDAKRLPDRISNGRKSGLLASIDPILVERDPATGEVINRIDFADRRRRIQVPLENRANPFGAALPPEEWDASDPQPDTVGGLDVGSFRPHGVGFFWNVPVLSELFFPATGPDREWATRDDPGFYVMEDYLSYRFAVKRVKGNVGGINNQTLGPYRPKDAIPAPGALRNRANPLRGPCVDASNNPTADPAVCDIRPAIGTPGDPDFVPALPGEVELPFRLAPDLPYAQSDAELGDFATAQGLYIPNAGFRRLLARSDLKFRPDQNFSQTELSLNHGASQGPWNELKEAYVDLEMFDHRLWLRIGRQTIVWGKTELFRAQDQFNPQDVGLSSLPTLEESRVPLWSARGVWSFYNQGPFDDVRLEVAMNWDEFVPIDGGRCGEPFAPRPSCARMVAYFGNALVGTGLAGELRPGYPWEHYDALEGGVRLEFRQDRISYALTYWNGRSDAPHVEPVFVFDRNVDPDSGRPRVEGGTGPCQVAGDPDCLGMLEDDPEKGLVQIDPDRESLISHHANQQLFTTICATTVTISNLLLEACGFNAWNSVVPAVEPDPAEVLTQLAPRLSMSFSALLAGSNLDPSLGPFGSLNGAFLLQTLGRYEDYLPACDPDCPPELQFDMPVVPLTRDPGDYDGAASRFNQPMPLVSQDDAVYCARLGQRVDNDPNIDTARCQQLSAPLTVDPDGTNYSLWRGVGLSRHLNDAQEGLMGCGRYWGTDCDVDGFDLMNTEGSIFFAAWSGQEGTEGGVWDTFGLQNREIPEGRTTYLQPGTIDGQPTSATFGQAFPQGPLCGRRMNTTVLPGCERADYLGPVRPVNPKILPGAPDYFRQGHPFTGDPFYNELSAASWNALMSFVALSIVPEEDDDGSFEDPETGELVVCGVTTTVCAELNGLHDEFEAAGVAGRFDEFNPLDSFALDRCSFRNPILCRSLAALLQVSASTAKSVRAGGNGRFGRRDFVWHGGAQVVLDYHRRNIFGVAMDFAEDRTRTNWNIEFTWFDRVQFSDNDSYNLTRQNHQLNLVFSIDRPTFLRPLNKNRTFFLNAQFFIRGIPGWRDSYLIDGPVNVLMTFSAFTGYYQDRLLPGVQVVFDVGSRSGAFLWSLGYRISQNLLLQIGLNAFWGRMQDLQSPIVPVGTTGTGVGRGKGSQRAWVENGLSTVRDRDEIFLRVRWNF